MDKDERIRRRAHEIWIEAGRPEGEDLKHWVQASEELNSHSALSENISVLGSEPAPTTKTVAEPKTRATAGSKRSARSTKTALSDNSAPEITTGKKPARKTIRKTEGP